MLVLSVLTSLQTTLTSALPESVATAGLQWQYALLLLLPLLLLLWLRDGGDDARRINALPGPRPVLPLIGSAYHIPTEMTAFMRRNFQLSRQFPGVFRLRLWHDHVVINSPEAAEAVYSSSEHIDKGEEYIGLLPWLGDGLLTSGGAKWRQRRKMLTPAFHFTILDKFLDVFNEQSAVLVSKLQETDGQKVDVFPFITRATLDVICETAMGVQIGSQQGAHLDYVKAVHDMGYIAFLRIIRPWLKINFIYKLTSLYQTQVKSLKLLHGFTDSVIKKRRQEMRDESAKNTTSASGKRRLAFLDLLLKSSIDGRPLTDIEIRDEVDTFMFEGHDTTSSAINWTLFNLGSYPDVQKRAYAEVQRVLGDDPSAAVTRDQLAELKYLEMVIKETLRLYPPVPMTGRRLNSDVVIDGYSVPQRCIIGLLIFAIHRDPRHWPQPRSFDPERFSPENSRGRHPYAFVPFSAGPRNCIGQKFAMMEMKVVLAQVLRRFHVTALQRREDLQLGANVILRAKGGLWLTFQPRKDH